MSRDALVFALSGTLFGLIIGWILGVQTADPRRPQSVAAASGGAAVAADGAGAPGAPAPRPLDLQRANALERQASAEPDNARVRVDLGNLYFDAERHDQAIRWYTDALRLDPKDVNASTDLAVSYYYSNQVDQALSQIEHSLSVDPNHLKTLLNRGIILAFGKGDLDGAAASWQKVYDLAPTSEEGRRARQGLDGIASAHAGGGAAGAGAGAAGSGGAGGAGSDES